MTHSGGWQAARLLPIKEVEEEAVWMEAHSCAGPHSVLRHPSMQLFWFRHLPRQDEASWDAFWTHFPKGVDA